MIKLNNVTKTYISKSKQRVEAIRGISAEFSDSGMVFILGKSGSGKSTLLNLLGGLDGATSGEISVDGVSFADFRQSDYDSYRNRYVGFVFQEFNLLRDFNVQDNVSIALELSKDEEVAEKAASALEQVGLSSDYLARKVDELSGGEKQRIAIARAVVKDSRLILADEPTGNLDSTTGESVWEILKTLSATKLVIVVTHDRESAERYGDRIIEIADGKVIADRGCQPEYTAEQPSFVSKKQRLSFRAILKLGLNNLLQRKAKSVTVILLSIFTILALLLTQMSLTYSSEKTLAKFIEDNDIEYFAVEQSYYNNGSFNRGGALFKKHVRDYIGSKANYIADGVVENKREIIDFGFTFVGNSLELDKNSYYVASDCLEMAYEQPNSFVMVEGEAQKLVKELHPAEYLIGKQVDLGFHNNADYILAGIIDTSGLNKLTLEAMPDIFAQETFGGFFYSTSNEYNTTEGQPELTIQFGKQNYGDYLRFEQSMYGVLDGTPEGKILTKEGLASLESVTLRENEIVLSYEIYSRLFPANSKWFYVNAGLTEVLHTPQEIGQSFSLSFSEAGSGEVIADFGEYTVKGIAFCTEVKDWRGNLTVCAHTDTLQKLKTHLNRYSKILIKTSSVANLSRFLVNLRDRYTVTVAQVSGDGSDDSGYINTAYDFEDQLSVFTQLFGIIGGILTVILVLFVINLISFSIVNRKKEIGILSALGTGRGDLTKIFIVETLVISVIAFIVNIIAATLFTGFFNAEYCRAFQRVLPLLRVDLITIATLFFTAFGLLLLAALLPIRKIIKLKPIDAIKDIV